MMARTHLDAYDTDAGTLLASADGGRSWSELTSAPGLPKGLWGKVGISVSGANSKRVYAIVEADSGGLFRSDDAGSTWTRVNDERKIRQRAFYYSRVHADPVDENVVYVLNVAFMKSTDGGKTFPITIRAPHSDHHDLWIDPDNPKDPVIETLSRHTVLLYIRGTEKDADELIKRFRHSPKPMYYQPPFLTKKWAEFKKLVRGLPEQAGAPLRRRGDGRAPDEDPDRLQPARRDILRSAARRRAVSRCELRVWPQEPGQSQHAVQAEES